MTTEAQKQPVNEKGEAIHFWLHSHYALEVPMALAPDLGCSFEQCPLRAEDRAKKDDDGEPEPRTFEFKCPKCDDVRYCRKKCQKSHIILHDRFCRRLFAAERTPPFVLHILRELGKAQSELNTKVLQFHAESIVIVASAMAVRDPDPFALMPEERIDEEDSDLIAINKLTDLFRRRGQEGIRTALKLNHHGEFAVQCLASFLLLFSNQHGFHGRDLTMLQYTLALPAKPDAPSFGFYTLEMHSGRPILHDTDAFPSLQSVVDYDRKQHGDRTSIYFLALRPSVAAVDALAHKAPKLKYNSHNLILIQWAGGYYVYAAPRYMCSIGDAIKRNPDVQDVTNPATSRMTPEQCREWMTNLDVLLQQAATDDEQKDHFAAFMRLCGLTVDAFSLRGIFDGDLPDTFDPAIMTFPQFTCSVFRRIV